LAEEISMKNIKPFACSLMLCTAFVLSGCILHRPAFYPAQVLMKDGVACFSVTDNREARVNPPELSVISVYSVDGEKISPVWRQMFPPDQPTMTLSPRECLAYGTGAKDVPALQPGFHYGVSMNGYIDGNNRMYMAYFCLYKTPDGKTDVHYAEWNDKTQERDWSVCGQD